MVSWFPDNKPHRKEKKKPKGGVGEAVGGGGGGPSTGFCSRNETQAKKNRKKSGLIVDQRGVWGRHGRFQQRELKKESFREGG